MRVVWTKRAAIQRLQQEKWLAESKGIDFARTFNANIDKAVGLISRMPAIGQTERPMRGEMQFRSILSHPKCRIVYGHDENTIIILKLRFMMMNE